MAFRAGEVEVVLKGNLQTGAFDAYDAKVQQSGAAAEAFEKKHNRAMASAGRSTAGLKAAGVGVGVIGAALVYATKQAADFEQQLNVFQATSKATGAQMKQVSGLAKQLGADVKLPATSAKDAADAMTELAKGGLSVKDSMQAARGVLQLSAAAQISNGEAANIVANNLQAFSLQGRDATKVADLLAAAANASTATIPQLAQGLQQTAASAHNLHIPLSDTVAMLTELSNKGIQGSDAGTSLKVMLQSLTPNSKQAGEAMKVLGVNAFDAEGKFRGIRPVIKDFHDALSGLSDKAKQADLKQIFGTDATRAASVIFGQGAAGLDKTRKAVNEVGAAQKLAEAQTKGFNGALAGLKSTVETVAINLGEHLLPGATAGAKGLTDLIQAASEGKGAAGDVAELASALARIGDSVGVFDALGAGFAGFKQAAGGAGQVLHGIAQTVEGIANLDIGQAFKGIGNIIGGSLKGVAGVVRVALSPISGAFKALGINITAPLRTAVSTAIGLFSSLIGAASSALSALSKVPGFGWVKGLASGIDDARAKLKGLQDQVNGVKPPKPVKLNIGADAKDAKAALDYVERRKLSTKVQKILGNAGDADTKIKALRALGIPAKTAKVLANVADALGGISNVKAALASVQSKRVTLAIETVSTQINKIINFAPSGPSGPLANRPRAAGRGAIGAERALVGEGGGPEWIIDPMAGTVMKTGGPTVMDLTPSTYVVPTEDKYRGRALGFMQMLAADMGLSGYKGGKAPKKKGPGSSIFQGINPKRFIPSMISVPSLPLDDITSHEAAARKAYTDVRDEAHDLPGKVRDDQKRVKDISGRAAKSKESKAKKARDLKAAKDKLAKDKAQLKKDRDRLPALRDAWKQQERELTNAKKYQAEIELQTSRVNADTTAMDLADKRNDQGAYEAARGKRVTDNKKLLKLYNDAKGKLDKDSKAYADLQALANATETDIQDASTAQSGAQQELAQAISNAPDPFEDLTAEEKARIAGLDKDQALAALTPDLGDDATTAGAKQQFLQGLLSQMTSGARPASDSLIGDVAGQLKQSMDNVASLSGAGTNDNADLQAQLDQANERTRVANDSARLNAQALSVFSGAGDIGTGGPNALRAAGPQVVFQSYVPPSPAEAMRLGNYVVGGLGYQGSVSSPRERLGI